MRRRTFLAGLGTAVAWPLAAPAQQPSRVRRIGWLSAGSAPGPMAQGFLQAIRELGYVDGENLRIEYRFAGGKAERLGELAAELVAAGVDVIVTAGTPATLAAKQATASIPIVFAAAGAPVEKGLVASLANPGGNVTGFALITDDLKPLEILKEAVPTISRVAFLYDPDTLPGAFGEDWLNRTQARARRLRVDLQPVILRRPDGARQVLDALPGGTDALLIANTATNAQARRPICTVAAQRRLPSASIERAFAEAGCLMTYGEHQADMHRRAAGYVDRILKGAKPADLPVEQPTRFQLVVNLKTATALGLTLPPLLLTRADEVIE
jgi:ABC-type uncharacterized transport system substrate-binding protein